MTTTVNKPKKAKNVNKLKIESRTSVTVRGLASYCLVSESTVRRWIQDGRIPAFRLPSGQYRITATGFKEFLTKYDMLNKD